MGGGTALAYEDRITLGAELGAGFFAGDAASNVAGGLGGVDVSFGLNDVWTLRSHFSVALHPGDATLGVGLIGTELLYTIDVVRWVPFFGAGIDALVVHGNGATHGDGAVHAVAGLDYLLSRDLLVGLDARVHVLPFAFDEGALDPMYITVNLRMELLFDL